jgi:hypothetical protein
VPAAKLGRDSIRHPGRPGEPHYAILVLLWIALLIGSIVALVAILFTGRYPRTLFDFNVGVLRCTWRVGFYTYSALGTDRYPPFTLSDVPGYPARLDVAYPSELSRGLVLVKWWLLPVPHLAYRRAVPGCRLGVLGQRVLATVPTRRPAGLLVLVGGIGLLFTGRYPQAVYDLVLGMNRWVFRVAAYGLLMTDRYPPFRLDMGPRSDPLT